MERKHIHTYRVYFEVEFHGKRRRRTLEGVKELPYIFTATDSGNICPNFIDAKNPIRAKQMAENMIKKNSQQIVNRIAMKTINNLPNYIEAKGPDGNYRRSKTFSSIAGARITELTVV